MKEFEAPKEGPGAGEGNRRGAAATAFGTHPAAPAAAAAAPHEELHKWAPQHTSQLEDLRLKAAEPVRVKIAYDFDAADVRTHSKAYARRSFNKQARDSRYSSYTDMGTPI